MSSAGDVKLNRSMKKTITVDELTLVNIYMDLLGEESINELSTGWTSATKDDYPDSSFICYYYKKAVTREQFAFELGELLSLHFDAEGVGPVCDWLMKHIEQSYDSGNEVNRATVKIADSTEVPTLIQLNVFAGDVGSTIELLFFYGESAVKDSIDLSRIGENKLVH